MIELATIAAAALVLGLTAWIVVPMRGKHPCTLKHKWGPWERWQFKEFSPYTETLSEYRQCTRCPAMQSRNQED